MFGTILKRRENTCTWRSGSTSPRSSRWPCCTSSTRWNAVSLPEELLDGTPACRTRWCSGGTATTPWPSSSPRPTSGLMYYFMPEGGESSGVLLPPVDHPLLGADLHLHLGGPAPLALHRAARLGAVAGHGVLDHADRALLGRYAQRPAHPARRLGPRAEDAVLKFMVVAVTAYGMATFEGPMLSIKSVNAMATTPTGRSHTCTWARWAGTAS
jgi:hypothetical protein